VSIPRAFPENGIDHYHDVREENRSKARGSMIEPG